MDEQSFDILIVGGGIVGLSLALGLATKTSLSIAVLEAKNQQLIWDESAYHHRVSALNLASQRFFSRLNIWQDLKAKRVTKFNKIEIWNANNDTTLLFDSHEIAESALGFIVENNLLQLVLKKHFVRYPQLQYFAPVHLQTLIQGVNEHTLLTQTGSFKARLIVAADGANSWIRKASHIDVRHFDYQEKALVAIVETEYKHDNIARQLFLPTGPLAFLPLADTHTSSIVWTLPKSKAQEYQQLSEDEFKIVLANAFENRLGHIKKLGKRYNFPLIRQETSQYVLPGIVLVGDAAHTIHPMAGLGVNMGLLDIGSLIDVITEALNDGRDFANLSTLRKYERFRKADNLPLLIGVDILKQLFASERSSVKFTLKFGLDFTNRFNFIKKFFTKYAVGNRHDLPKMFMK